MEKKNMNSFYSFRFFLLSIGMKTPWKSLQQIKGERKNKRFFATIPALPKRVIIIFVLLLQRQCYHTQQGTLRNPEKVRIPCPSHPFHFKLHRFYLCKSYHVPPDLSRSNNLFYY